MYAKINEKGYPEFLTKHYVHSGDKLYLTFHSPNASEQEHPRFVAIEDRGDHFEIQA